MFKMNSTKLVPNKKPRIVDNYKKRNINSNLSITIPFNVTLDTGIMQNVYSVDTLSLLSGSSTFNHFARVFDQFKVQSVHLCIDLAAPATSDYEMKALFTLPLDENFNRYGYALYENGQKGNFVNVQQFKNACNAIFSTTFWDQTSDQFHFPAGTQPAGILMGAFLASLIKGDGCCISNSVLTHGQNVLIFDETVAPDKHTRIYYNVAADTVQPVPIQCTTYQMIGAAGLRQIPRGFYNAPTVNNEVVMKPNIYEEGFIESCGNYIHQSYMPGAPLHLSLDMIGTSATEKSLYFPTSVCENISALDSLNQSGRFCPVCLVQNKLKYNNGRDILVNGSAVENAYNIIYENQNQLVRQITFTFDNLDGKTYVLVIPFCYYPTVTIGDTAVYNVAGVYDCVGALSVTGVKFNDITTPIDNNNWTSWVYNKMPLSNVAYCLYEDILFKLGGGQLSIQAFVDIRFKDLRNVLASRKVNYPYLQAFIDGTFVLGDETYSYRDCNLISTVDFEFAKHLDLDTSVDSIVFLKPNVDNKQGVIDLIVRKVTGAQAFCVANAVDKIGVNTRVNNFNFRNKVIGGIIIPVKKFSVPAYTVFNCFSIAPNTDFTVNGVLGANQGTKEFYVFTLVTHPCIDNGQVIDDNNVRNNQCVAAAVNTVPDGEGKVGQNQVWLIQDYNCNIEFNLSRIRSIGYSDGALNSIIEHHLDPESLKNGKGVLDMGNTQRNGVYVCRSFGGIVGGAPGSLSGQL